MKRDICSQQDIQLFSTHLKTKVHLFFQLFKNLFAQRISPGAHTHALDNSNPISTHLLFLFVFVSDMSSTVLTNVLLKILILAPLQSLNNRILKTFARR